MYRVGGKVSYAGMSSLDFKVRWVMFYIHAVSDYKKRWSEVSAGVS